MTTINVPIDGIPGVVGIQWSTDTATTATLSVDGWTYNNGNNDWEIWGIVLTWAWVAGARLWSAEIHAFVGRFDEIVAESPKALGSPQSAVAKAVANVGDNETIRIDAVGAA